jgi:hypothetical protein
VNTGLERILHFVFRLADSREDHRLRISSGSQYPIEFAGRDDVETGSFAGQEGQDRKIRVRFDGVTDPVRQVGESAMVLAEPAYDGVAGINVRRGTVVASHRVEIRPLTEKMTFDVMKITGMMH